MLMTIPSSLHNCGQYICVAQAVRSRCTHMKPITALTLMIAKTNSASPKLLTPHKLMAMMTIRKTVTKTPLLIVSFQYDIVIEAAIISRGSTVNHCKA